jgi:hypothetical protein
MTPFAKSLAASFALGLVLAPELAIAQYAPWPTYRGDRRYEDDYTTRTPRRGYTGWGSGPLLGTFCDYQRTPVRRCNNGRCRVVAWNMTQYCY